MQAELRCALPFPCQAQGMQGSMVEDDKGVPWVRGGKGERRGGQQSPHGESAAKASSPISSGGGAALCCSLIGASVKYNLAFPVNRIREMQI